MEKKIIYLPIGYRILSIFLFMFFLYGTIFFIIENEYIGALLFFLGLLGFTFLLIMIFVHYIFTNDKICIKIPFFKKSECKINDIIGYNLFAMNSQTVFFIYTKEKYFIIQYTGKKIKNEIKVFIKNNYEKIKNKNIEELNNSGIEVKISKNKYIKCFTEYLEIFNKETKERYNYEELIPKHLNIYNINLITKEKKKIYFNLHQCKGKIGFFEYLINYKWVKLI